MREKKPTAILLRVPETLREQLKKEAEREGVSLNQFCLWVLAEKVGERSISPVGPVSGS